MVHDGADVPVGPASLDSVRVEFNEERLVSDAGLLIAATLAASMAVATLPTASFASVTPVPGHVFGGGSGFAVWPIFACAGGIITSALVANYRDNRELTAPEAWTCGVAFWFAQPGKHKKGKH